MHAQQREAVPRGDAGHGQSGPAPDPEPRLPQTRHDVAGSAVQVHGRVRGLAAGQKAGGAEVAGQACDQRGPRPAGPGGDHCDGLAARSAAQAFIRPQSAPRLRSADGAAAQRSVQLLRSDIQTEQRGQARRVLRQRAEHAPALQVPTTVPAQHEKRVHHVRQPQAS